MNRRTMIGLGGAAVLLAACSTNSAPQLDGNGQPLPQVYRINAANQDIIPFRLLDSVNTLRAAKGGQALMLNATLNAAALTHSRDMSVQNRPWHFGSDGSSPLVRVQRLGFTGKLLGELISETYQTELETLSAWMSQADTRDVILDPMARDAGFAWFQEENGKIWWTFMTAA